MNLNESGWGDREANAGKKKFCLIENTRVVGQKELEHFREAMSTKMNDPYTVLLRQNKLPMSLLADHKKVCVTWKSGLLDCKAG